MSTTGPDLVSDPWNGIPDRGITTRQFFPGACRWGVVRGPIPRPFWLSNERWRTIGWICAVYLLGGLPGGAAFF